MKKENEIAFLTNCLLKSFNLFASYIFCGWVYSKTQVTIQKHFNFASDIILLCLHCFASVITEKSTAVLGIIIDMCCFCIYNEFLAESIYFIKLNQTRKYFLNRHCKVHKKKCPSKSVK